MRSALRMSSVGRWRLPRCQATRDQRGRFGGADFRERFGRSDDLDDAPVFELQPIAAAQQHRLVEIEQEIETAHARHRHPPAMAFVVVEHYGIGGFAGPAAGGDDVEARNMGEAPKGAPS